MVRLTRFVTILALSALTARSGFAQTNDDAQQEPVQMFGPARQYVSETWRNLFPDKVEICVGYGTEKETWLRQEAAKFARNPANKNLTIKLVPTGSVASAEAIEQRGGRVGSGSDSCTMTAWSPASAVYRDYALQRSYRAMSLAGLVPPGVAGANDLIAAQAQSLVRIPLVLVLWNNAYTRVTAAAQKADPLATDATSFTFAALTTAQQATYPNNQYITFHTTNPGESNSGFSSLLLMAYEFGGAGRGGPDANALNPRNTEFWGKVRSFYTSNDGKTLNNYKVASTGTLFRDQFVLSGPAGEISGVMTYENLAIQYAEQARLQHQQAYRVIYPARSVMSDNPYYVMNVMFDTTAKKVVVVPEKEKKAAIAFMQFLLEPEQQREAVALGFRPGNVQAGIDVGAPGSPFVALREIGIQAAPASVRFVSTTAINEAVIGNLLSGWKAIEASLK